MGWGRNYSQSVALVLKYNLVANFLGQGWAALMGLVFIPLYVRYMGVESYGLVGIYAMLQAWLGILDMGMTPTLSREMAQFTGGQHSAQSIRDLLRSVEVIACVIAVVIGGAAFFLSGRIAIYWLHLEKLSAADVAQAFVIMGVVASLRFMESIYRSALVGLQKQVLLNVLSCFLATLRWGGAVAVLALFSATIQAFFLWQALVSLMTIVLFAAATYRILPSVTQEGRFSLSAIRSVGHFAGGMIGITFMALLLTQIDKILLSKLLSLHDFGYYTLAATVAGGLTMLVNPITQAFFPRFSELHARGDVAGLVDTYHLGAQIVSVVMGSAAIVLIVFASPILRIWTGDHELAQRSAPLVRILAFGNLLNGLMWLPYQVQLAYGWTSLAVKINFVAVSFIIPCILWATPRFGAEGAAWAWIALNVGYLAIAIHFMHRRILPDEKMRWYYQDVLVPLAGALAVVVVAHASVSDETARWCLMLVIAVGGVLAVGISALMATKVRSRLLAAIASRARTCAI